MREYLFYPLPLSVWEWSSHVLDHGLLFQRGTYCTAAAAGALEQDPKCVDMCYRIGNLSLDKFLFGVRMPNVYEEVGNT